MLASAEHSLRLAAAFKQACVAELEALKPGNVHIFADGHGMVVDDFVRSAVAAAAVISKPQASVGQRILEAVNATWDEVACNTNLGIILLCAPLIQAALQAGDWPLRERLERVLQGLTVEDAAAAYRAIQRASPAGLGQSAHHDVHVPPQVSLLTAMREAADRDRIAWQYAHGFADIFEFGVNRYQQCCARWQRPAWAASAVYLGFLARFADSHIARKHGLAVAEEVRQEAAAHEAALLSLENPKNYQRELLRFDAGLKARGLNPGTSADLTVATLLAVELERPFLA